MPHLPEEVNAPFFFEACIPVEEPGVARTAYARFSPMRPVGLVDPHTGNRPLCRRTTAAGEPTGHFMGLRGLPDAFMMGRNSVGVFMIPALEHAELVRYGVMHRQHLYQITSCSHCRNGDATAPRFVCCGPATGVGVIWKVGPQRVFRGHHRGTTRTGCRRSYRSPRRLRVPYAGTLQKATPLSFLTHERQLRPLAFSPSGSGRRARGEAYAARSLVALEHPLNRKDLPSGRRTRDESGVSLSAGALRL